MTVNFSSVDLKIEFFTEDRGFTLIFCEKTGLSPLTVMMNNPIIKCEKNMSFAEENLSKMNLQLPQVSAPVAKYVPFIIAGDQVIISGQISKNDDGSVLTGKAGADRNTEAAKKAAQNCGLQIIAVLKEACGGDLSIVKKCVRIGGFVNAVPDYAEQPEVINGVSELMVAVFGEEIGMHARAAVGVGSLPRNALVEAEAQFIIDVK